MLGIPAAIVAGSALPKDGVSSPLRSRPYVLDML